jgi:branched-chain amino acid transport system substrate-binding protein
MRKILAVVLTLVLAMSLVAVASAQQQEYIVIGGIQDLSGPAVQSGLAMHQGTQLAVDAINAAGGINGKQLKYICYDIKSDVQEAMNAYLRLVDQDGAVVVIGPPISNVGLALKDTVIEKKVPVIGAFIDSRVTKNPDTGAAVPYNYLVQPTNQQSGIIQASYLVDVLGLKKVALFYDQGNAFGVSQVEAFKAYVQGNGGEITTEQIFKTGDKDFKTQLTKIMASGAQAIFAPNYPEDNVLYCTQLNQLGMTDMVTMGGLDFAPPFLNSVPDKTIVDKVYFALNCAFDEEQLQDLNKKFIDTFMPGTVADSNTISVKVYLGYDATNLAAEALRRCKDVITGENVNAMLETIDAMECKTGTIGFSAESHQPIGLSMVMYRIDKGENVKLGRYVPEVLK